MDRPWRRSALLLSGLLTAVGVPAALAWPSLAATTPRTLSVSNSAALASAVANAQPGDRIMVADGVYGTALKMTRSGTPTAPITIAARDPGQAQLTSPDAIRFGAVSHVTVQGFTFSGNASLSVPAAAAAVRITRNPFTTNRSGDVVTVSADNT